jgi:hypothetical protein
MRQTTIQVPDAIRKGSVRVLVGDDFDSLVDIGALRNPNINFLNENQRVEFDNAQGLDYFVKGDRIQVTFDLAEINFDTIAVLDAGLVNLESVAGSLVEGAEQLVVSGSWNYNTFIKIANQNGNGSAITVNSVTASTDGALTAGTDFYVGQDGNGAYGIFVVDSEDVTTLAQNITIDYDYTPSAAKVITTNETGKKTLKVMRIINENNDGKLFRLDIAAGTNKAPISFDFAGDEEEDVAIQPVDFQGEFVEYYDEQQTS